MMIIIKNILPLLTIDDINLESFKISNFEYFWLKYANKYVILELVDGSKMYVLIRFYQSIYK